MRRISLAPEPTSFDADVRQPGADFLATTVAGQKIDYTKKDFWRTAIPHLRRAYGAICAYTCHWIAYDVGSSTVDHFISKDIDPTLAYEWDNYRLACGRMNGRKGKYDDVVDPFDVVTGMFVLDFPSMQIKPGSGLTLQQEALAGTTIDRLKLNDEGCIEARVEYVVSLRDKEIDFVHLQRKAPFIAAEIARQGIVNSLDVILKDYPPLEPP